MKLDEQETLSPFASMHAHTDGAKYDLDSVEIGEYTENYPEPKVLLFYSITMFSSTAFVEKRTLRCTFWRKEKKR